MSSQLDPSVPSSSSKSNDIKEVYTDEKLAPEDGPLEKQETIDDHDVYIFPSLLFVVATPDIRT